jgi:hypothetical protein
VIFNYTDNVLRREIVEEHWRNAVAGSQQRAAELGTDLDPETSTSLKLDGRLCALGMNYEALNTKHEIKPFMPHYVKSSRRFIVLFEEVVVCSYVES